jgi:hypothetical protein
MGRASNLLDERTNASEQDSGGFRRKKIIDGEWVCRWLINASDVALMLSIVSAVRLLGPSRTPPSTYAQTTVGEVRGIARIPSISDLHMPSAILSMLPLRPMW